LDLPLVERAVGVGGLERELETLLASASASPAASAAA
jgi:hypothetical protein